MRSLLILFMVLGSVLPKSSENLSYEVRYKLGVINTKVATATLRLSKDAWEGQAVMKSNAQIAVQPVFKLFLKDKYQASICLSAQEMKPLYYAYPHAKGFNECRYHADSIYYKRTLRGKAPETIVLPNDSRTMEIFSMLYMIRDLELKTGETVSAKTYLSGFFRNIRITLIGIDTERYPGRKADAILIETPERGLMENGSGNIIRIWRASDGARPVLGIEVPLSTGTMIANLKNEL